MDDTLLLDPARAARFWAKIAPAAADECWLWTAAKNERGYGLHKASGQRGTSRAHRVTWELLRGEIPAGLELDHLCRTRACVNPWHCDPVSHLENMRRAIQPSETYMAKVRNVPPTCYQGHEYTPDNTYVYRNRRVCRTCRRAKMAASRAAKRAQ